MSIIGAELIIRQITGYLIISRLLIILVTFLRVLKVNLRN